MGLTAAQRERHCQDAWRQANVSRRAGALAHGGGYQYGAIIRFWARWGEGYGARALGPCGRAKGKKPPAHEKATIGSACEAFIEDVLKPRFLPEIRPTTFNYCVDIFGKWHGGHYRFIQRFRSDDPEAIEPEFDAPFARLEYLARDRFNLSYFRHNGQWWTVHRGVTLAEAIGLLETEGIFHPVS